MARKIQILEIIDRLADGGAEALLVTFARGLDHDHFDLHVLALRPWPQSQIKSQLQVMGVRVTELNQSTAYDLPALGALIAYVREQRIDIIHTHLLAADIMGRMVGFFTRHPVVSTIHNNRRDLDEEPRRRQWMERWTAHLWCQRLAVVSSLLQKEITDWFGLPPERVLTIANGVDTERFQRGPNFDRGAVKQALVGGDHPLVVNVARLVPQKAQNYLIEATAIIARERPDVRVLLLGDGPLREELEALAARLGVSEQVVFTGFRRDIPDVLAASEVFVLSSLWEGMPVALLEAMAAGCAAVCTNVGGVAQLIETGQRGLLVTPGDAPALATAILRCLNDPAYARQLGQAAQAWVTGEYGMRAWVQKWESLYLEVLSERGRRRRGGARQPQPVAPPPPPLAPPPHSGVAPRHEPPQVVESGAAKQSAE